MPEWISSNVLAGLALIGVLSLIWLIPFLISNGWYLGRERAIYNVRKEILRDMEKEESTD